ncbi:MAG: FAD-binding oxidoreductase [Spirochaetaceae bacterium]
MEYSVRVIALENVTHDTRRLVLEKPRNYRFEPGQATEIAIEKPAWREEYRPFSFTSLPETSHLEFIVKVYPAHEGVTSRISQLDSGDRVVLSDPFGTIRYRGPGCFIAGGSGITPFIAIFRHLFRNGGLEDNVLLYSNRTEADIILKDELDRMLGENVIYHLTHEPRPNYEPSLIGTRRLRRYTGETGRFFYVCGPEEMVEDVRNHLRRLGVEDAYIVLEE